MWKTLNLGIWLARRILFDASDFRNNKQQKRKKSQMKLTPQTPLLSTRTEFLASTIKFKSVDLRRGICIPQSDIHYK